MFAGSGGYRLPRVRFVVWQFLHRQKSNSLESQRFGALLPFSRCGLLLATGVQ